MPTWPAAPTLPTHRRWVAAHDTCTRTNYTNATPSQRYTSTNLGGLSSTRLKNKCVEDGGSDTHHSFQTTIAWTRNWVSQNVYNAHLALTGSSTTLFK